MLSPDARKPIQARLIDDTTIAACGVIISAPNPIAAMARRLVRDGHDLSLPLQVWRGSRLIRMVRAIGHPSQVRLKNGGLHT